MWRRVVIEGRDEGEGDMELLDVTGVARRAFQPRQPGDEDEGEDEDSEDGAG